MHERALHARFRIAPWRGRSSVFLLCIAGILTGLHLRGAAGAEAEKVHFNFQIKPLLSDRCYACHGPDEKSRKAKLRLDAKESAMGLTKKGKPIITPGKADESELYRRITSTDPDEKMPPPESNLVLSPAEVDLLKRWIDQGAEWQKHWAFVPPVKTSPPPVQNRDWPTQELDRFILARIEKAGLKPAAEASKEKFLRRVTFDLTGLPPTIEDLDAFLRDSSTNACEKVVDRLLASPAYGERMAVDWLDAARYADTHGYQADRYRATWPWRDWVIKAFNENMPYHQFVTWQLAGDLLPNATQEQRLATAFNRIHMQTEEGGSVEEEFRVAYVVDRVNTMGTSLMALTFECSRCHDHKFDPISQKDFYSLFSFFNNIDESGQTSYFTDSTPVPALLLSDKAQDEKLSELHHQIRGREKQFALLRERQRGVFQEWFQREPHKPVLNQLVASLSFENTTNNSLVNEAAAAKAAQMVDNPKLVPGKIGKALLLSGDNGVTMGGIGNFSRTTPFSVSLWLLASNLPPRAVVFHRSQASLDAGSRGYEMVLEEGRVSLGLHHMWPNNSLKVFGKNRLPTNQWVHLALVYDGSSRAEGLKLYWNGAPADTEIIRDNLTKDIGYERSDPAFAIGYRFRDNGFKGGMVDELRIFSRAITSLEAAHLAGQAPLVKALSTPWDELSQKTRDQLLDYYLGNFNLAARKYQEDLLAVRTEQSKLIQSIPEIMTMREMQRPRQARVLKRGAYDAPGDPVSMGTPASILPFPDNLPRNRLGLAKWLLSPEHPLTARVTVNRYWQLMFGRGIVATTDNFGSQGELPTHPELLDWLAIRFRESGWNVKALLKEIALSATYRQSSKGDSESLARDPENKLLSRAPSYRLPAEMLRDNALAASGLLVRKTGGPPVKPYQPEGLWEEKSGAHYDQDKGEGLYRRSIYTFWKRTVPHPAMIAFDAAERNVCIVRRQTTSTPLQGLVLLNDTQYVEAARFLAERMLHEGGTSLDDQLTYLFRLLTSRKPNAKELSVLKSLYYDQETLFSKNKQGALTFVSNGEKLYDISLDPVQLAAAATVASALLNYDEVVTKR